MDLKIKQTMAVLTVVLLAVGCLVPIINETVRQHDADPLTVPIGAHAVDDLDGWGLELRKASTGFSVNSSLYKGTMTRTGIVLSSDAVTVWTDTNRIYMQIGGTVTVGTTLSVLIEGSTMTVNDIAVTVTGEVYVPDTFGAYGSYAGATHNPPLVGAGSYAGIALVSNGDEIAINTSDYVIEVEIIEDGALTGIEFVAGYVDIPEIDPYLPDIEHEDDPEPEPAEPGEVTSSGSTGACTWELDGTVLYIRGNGSMGDYWADSTPPNWGRDITTLYVEEGVTTVGVKPFQYCKDLTYVSLPSTLTSIRSYAFRGCTSLTEIDIPDSLVTLEGGAFNGCTSLTSLVLPEGLTAFGSQAIQGCSSLRHLYIPSTAETISGQSGFHFIRLDGYDMGNVPSGDLYLGTKQYVMYQTKTIVEDGATYHINYLGAELETAQNTETVHIPYTVEYNGTDYTVESIGHGAVSGSSVRYVVIPQTIESVSHTAITGSGVKEILNLSATEVTASHGEVRTSVPAVAVIAEPVPEKGFSAVSSMLWIIPLMLVAGAVISIVREFARARYD